MKIFFTIASLIVISCSLEWYEEDNPVFLTDENFTQIMSVPRTYKFVKLFTPWCHFCRVLKEIVKELKPQYEHRKDIQFYEVNCHLNQNTCFQLQAFSFPTTVLYGPDGKLKEKIVGTSPLPTMKAFIDRNTQQEFKEQETNRPPQNIVDGQIKSQEEVKHQQDSSKPAETGHISPINQPEDKAENLKPEKQAQPKPQGTNHQISNSQQATWKKTIIDTQGSVNSETAKLKKQQKQETIQQVTQNHKPEESKANVIEVKQPVQEAIKESGLKNSESTLDKQLPKSDTKLKLEPSQSLPKKDSNNPRQSLQDHNQAAPGHISPGLSKLQILIYVGIGAVLGYFVHDLVNKEFNTPNEGRLI